MKWHHHALTYPTLEGADYDAFRADIAASQGPREPVKYRLVGKTKEYLDGRNRVRVCDELELAYREECVEVDDEDVVAYIDSLNLHRRHLTVAQQEVKREERRARVAAAKARGESNRTIAEGEGVSESTVRNDVKASGAQGCAPEPPDGKVTGKDGKTYPAEKPELPTCERCKRAARVGQTVPKNCEMCKELREPKPAPAKNPHKKEPILDAFRNEVPAKCRKAYADPWMTETVDFLAEVEEKIRTQRIADGINKRKSHYPFVKAKDVIDGIAMAMNTLDEILQHLKTNRPAGVCPSCSGTGCADCKLCGMVPREVYGKLK